jgi:preprotein translocase subunit SecD
MSHAASLALVVGVVLAACGSPARTPSPEGFRLEPVRPARAAQLDAARDLLQSRLDLMRPGVAVTVVDDGIFVAMPLNEATPSFVKRLTSRGEVWLVPIPAGADIPVAGQPLDLRPLIRNDGFADARLGAVDGRPRLELAFTPEAAAVLGAHTSAHVGETLAIVVDGIVISAPIIQSPILGGEMVIEGPSDQPEELAWVVEILRDGVLEIELNSEPS